jgi:hypothetical protein
MRCWASSALSAGALALLCAAPAAAKPVGEFAQASNAFLDARQAARPRADAAAQRRRDAAAACLDVFQATPVANRELVYVAYFVDEELGLFEVYSPIYRRLLARLERMRLRPEPELMKARRVLRTTVSLLELLPLVLDDPCTTARAWQAAGWRTPPRSIRVIRRIQTISEASDYDLEAAARLLRRAGHRRAAREISNVFDPGDAAVERAGDPVRCALMPDDCG